jgi:hypothetical protein
MTMPLTLGTGYSGLSWPSQPNTGLNSFNMNYEMPSYMNSPGWASMSGLGSNTNSLWDLFSGNLGNILGLGGSALKLYGLGQQAFGKTPELKLLEEQLRNYTKQQEEAMAQVRADRAAQQQAQQQYFS